MKLKVFVENIHFRKLKFLKSKNELFLKGKN